MKKYIKAKYLNKYLITDDYSSFMKIIRAEDPSHAGTIGCSYLFPKSTIESIYRESTGRVDLTPGFENIMHTFRVSIFIPRLNDYATKLITIFEYL